MYVSLVGHCVCIRVDVTKKVSNGTGLFQMREKDLQLVATPLVFAREDTSVG